jgi:hypothetical protein
MYVYMCVWGCGVSDGTLLWLLQALDARMSQLGAGAYLLPEYQAVLGLAQRSAVALGQDETAFSQRVQNVRTWGLARMCVYVHVSVYVRVSVLGGCVRALRA